MLRWLRVEAGQNAAQHAPELRRRYQRFKFRRGANVAKVAMARRLAVLLYGKLRQAQNVAPPVRTPGSPARTLVDVDSPTG
jgi:hypothetical protein